MRDGDAIVVEHVQCIADLVLVLFAAARSLHGGDEDAADLELARAGEHMGGAFDRVAVVVTGRVVADGDQFGFEFERVVAHGLVVKGVGDDGGVVAFGQSKTGMSVPGDFHID